MIPQLSRVLLLCALALGACSSPAVVLDGAGDGGGQPDPSAVASVDGEWVLVEGRGSEGPLVLSEQGRVTLVIEGSQIGGTAACNGYGGEIVSVLPAWDVGEIAQTEMACHPPELMDLERAFLTALVQADTAERTASGLTLTGASGVELRFEELPPVPTAELIGTTWQLDTVIVGQGADGAASSVVGEPATLVLREDGTLEAATGCRTLTGTWQVFGGEVVTPELRADGECPDELRTQDDHVITVLGDGFMATVDGRRLTLSDGELGLGYAAVE